MNRLKSILMWAGVIATAVMGYVATNSTAAIGGNSSIDKIVIFICGFVAVLSAVNNPTNQKGL